MNVLNIIPGYYPATVYGGPVFSVHFACQALARRNLNVHVATTNVNGFLGAKLDVPTSTDVVLEANYTVRYYSGSHIGHWSWALFQDLKRIIEKADIVHLQDVYSVHALLAICFSIVQHRPIVISPRGIFSSWALSSGRRVTKRLWTAGMIRPLVGNHCRVAWHATSAMEKIDILRVFPGSTVHVVPNAIDVMSISAGERLDRASYVQRFFPNCTIAADRAFVLVAMGRLHSIKGFDIAIRCLAELGPRLPECILLIAGNNEGELANLEALIAALDLKGRVALVGPQYDQDKAAFLTGADIYLFPSHSENFGIALLEGLAAGLPVVASRKTPWDEVETAGSGLWVQNTPAAFADAIVELHGQDLQTLQKNARAHAAAYDLDSIAISFERIYSEMINGNPS